MKRYVALTAVAVSLSLAGASRAAVRSDARLDRAVTAIAGFPVTVVGEDDPAAWASYAPSSPAGESEGFAIPFAPPSDPHYHKVYIGPTLWPLLEAFENKVVPLELYRTALALLVLVHETEHLKLVSLDEGRVNACALKAFPAALSADFHVPATIAHKVRRKNKLVTVRKPNPLYRALVGNAKVVYASEPPPYSTGTCSS